MNDDNQLGQERLSPAWLRHGYVWPILAVAILVAVQWNQFGIFGSDEPRVAGVANGMVCSGNWVVPQLNGRQFLEKPPLFFWGLAGLYQLVGTDADVSRLISAVATAGVLLMVWAFARAAGLPYAVALLAAIATATCEGIGGDCWKCTMDMLLCFFVTGAFVSFYLADKQRSRFLLWGAVFAIMFSGALMTKSLVGIALPGIGMTVWLLWKRRLDWRLWGLLTFGTVVSLLVFCAWLYAVYRNAGMDAVRTVVWTNNFQRFLGTQPEQAHMKPFYYYFPRLCSELFPWSLLIPHAVWQMVRQSRTGKLAETTVYLLCMTIAPFLLLTASSSKRSVYLLPLLPVFSLLIVHSVSDYLSEARWEHKMPGPLRLIQVGCVVLITAIPVYCFVKEKDLIWVSLIVSAVSLVALLLLRRWSCGSPLSRYVVHTGVAVGLVGLGLTIAVFIPRSKERDYEPVFTGLTRWQKNLPTPPSVCLYRPNERLLGAAVYGLNRSVPTLYDERKLTVYLTGKSAVVVADRGSFTPEMLGSLDIALEVKTDRKRFVIARIAEPRESEVRSLKKDE